MAEISTVLTWIMPCFVMSRVVVWYIVTNDSEEHLTSIFSVRRIHTDGYHCGCRKKLRVLGLTGTSRTKEANTS